MEVTTQCSDDYLTNREWFEKSLEGEKVVLCFTSALECLQLFSGYVGEQKMNVYAEKAGNKENVNYHMVASLDKVETVKIGKLVCTSVSQTMNDMLGNLDTIDEQALVEALNCFYFSNNRSFDSLNIYPHNQKKFNELKNWAIEYYMEG